MKIKEIFKEYVSSGAFKHIDDEIRLVGKYGQVSLIEDVFDIWFVSELPLTQRKLSALLKKIPENVGFTRLDTEAYIQTSDISVVLKLLPICGIRRKKRNSKQTKTKLIKRMEILNKADNRTNHLC